MDFSFKKRPVKRLYGEYTILFIFLALCIFGTYLVTGHTFILSKDALNQHLPLLAKYREALISFFHHPRLNFWSWQMGLGSDTFKYILTIQLGTFSLTLHCFFPQQRLPSLTR